MAAQLSLVLNDMKTISDDERRKNRDFALCKKNLSKRDFQRHYVSKHRKGFHPRFFCRACSLVFACNYSFRVHWTKKHEHLVKKNLDERMNYAGEKDCEATKKKLELRDAVVWSRNGSSIGCYKVAYMKSNGNFILRDFYPDENDIAIGIRKNDTSSFMYHALTFIKHSSEEFFVNKVTGFENVEKISKSEYSDWTHICPDGYEMTIETYANIPIIKLANVKDGVQCCSVKFMMYELIAFLQYINSKTFIVDDQLFQV